MFATNQSPCLRVSASPRQSSVANLSRNDITYWANSSESIFEDAYREACNLGLAALDAIHVAAAKSVGAEELITTEKLSKPIHRATGIKVVSIFP